jgi:hypothetical protein
MEVARLVPRTLPRHRESLGAWLTGKERARAVARAMMMPVRRKLGIRVPLDHPARR